MVRSINSAGSTLIETLVALFLTSVTVLAAAPMFMHAAQATDASADRGSVGVIAVDRMEKLRYEIWRDLDAGGSLTSNVAGFFDDSDPSFVVRWQVTDNLSPSRSKTIDVVAEARGDLTGPRRRVVLTMIRGR